MTNVRHNSIFILQKSASELLEREKSRLESGSLKCQKQRASYGDLTHLRITSKVSSLKAIIQSLPHLTNVTSVHVRMWAVYLLA
jgi:hypothetical protein